MRFHTNIFGTILLILIGTFSVDSFSQTLPDYRLVTTDREVNFAFSDKRGIKADNGIIFLVGQDRQTLTAYDKDQVKWTVNIIKTCGQAFVGKPEIRHIKLSGDKIYLTFGKHSLASVDIKDGKAKCLGSD